MLYILLFSLLIPLTTVAQLRIDSIRITQESIPFVSSTDGAGLSSWSKTIIPEDDTVIVDAANEMMHYSTFSGMGRLSFALDSNAETVHTFSMSTSTGHPGDIQGYSETNWGFLKDTIVRVGKDFRIFLFSEELGLDNFGFSTTDKVRIGPGQYKESSSYSTAPIASSWVEVIFYGSVPLDVAAPDRNSFAVYPNPASQSISIAGISEDEPVRIFDLAGREYEIRCSFTGSEHVLDIRTLENGLYVVRGGSYIQKFIVVH